MVNTPIPERYLTAAEAADFLGLALGTVQRMGHRGELPSVKIGSARRYTREALAAWVAAQNPSPEGAAA